MKLWINHHKLKHYLLRGGGAQCLGTCGISCVPPLLSPLPALLPSGKPGVFFLPRESVGIGTLVLWGAACSTVMPNGDRESALHPGAERPQGSRGDAPGNPTGSYSG